MVLGVQESRGKMTEKEKERFKERIKEFSRDRLVGWLDSINYLLPRVNTSLQNELIDVFNICENQIMEVDGNGVSRE